MRADPPRTLLVITRGEPGGAQMHVRDLVVGLQGRVAFTVAVGDDEFLARSLRDHDVPVRVVPGLRRAVDPGTDLAALRALRALVGELQPHLVHTHSTKAGLLGRIAARLSGVPCLHTAHAWSFSDGQPRRRVLGAVPPEVLVGRITDRFIVVSEADREVALRYRVARPHQVEVIHNGVPDTAHRADPGDDAVPVLTMVARMAAPKDHALLLRALATRPEPWRLQLVGDGLDRAALETLATSLGIHSRIDWLGVRDDVPQILAGSHIALLISRQEGFPLVVLEAMRAGLPVIASDVGGIREALTHGHDGLLVARNDQAALAEALRALMNDAAQRRSMGRWARQTYDSRFRLATMIEKTAAVYRTLAEAHRFPCPLPAEERSP